MRTKSRPEKVEQSQVDESPFNKSLKEAAIKAAEWFLPLVGLTYGCGFLIVFTFFKSFGINTVEFIEAKYIHIGSLFVMACTTIILPMRWLFIGIKRWLDDEEGKNRKEVKDIIKGLFSGGVLGDMKFWETIWRRKLWRREFWKSNWSVLKGLIKSKQNRDIVKHNLQELFEGWKFWKAFWKAIKWFFLSDWRVSTRHGIHATFPVMASAAFMLWCFLLLLTFAKPDFSHTHSKLFFFNLLIPLAIIALAIPADWIRNKSVPKTVSSTFLMSDLVNLPSFANKLRQPADTTSTYLKKQLSAETLIALANYQGSSSDQEPLKTSLVEDLNRIICGQSIHTVQCFVGGPLHSKTLQLLAQNPQGDALIRLNRLLLEDAYPRELLSKQEPENKENEDFLYPWPTKILKYGRSLIRIWWMVVGLRYLYLFFWERPLFYDADQQHPDGQLHRLIIRFFVIPVVTMIALWFLLFFWQGIRTILSLVLRLLFCYSLEQENDPVKTLQQRLTVTRWVLYPIQWTLFLGQFWFFLRVIIKENLGVSLREVFVGKDWPLFASFRDLVRAILPWVFSGKNLTEEQIHKLFPVGGFIFIFSIVLLVFFAVRHFYRAKQLQEANLRTMISAFCLLGVLFYFAILSFARHIYPYIPAVKGGGDYTWSHPVKLTFDTNFVSSIPQPVMQGVESNRLILLDANSSFVFLAATNDAGGPEKWRSNTETNNRPAVYEIRREAIISITYLNPTNLDTGTNSHP
jgi:hypothetical protein